MQKRANVFGFLDEMRFLCASYAHQTVCSAVLAEICHFVLPFTCVC